MTVLILPAALLFFVTVLRAQADMVALEELSCNGALSAAGPDKVTWSTWSSTYIMSSGIAKIPCGKAVVMTGSQKLTLKGLHVEGWLKFQDDADKSIETDFVVVEGHIFAGSSSSPFKKKLEITIKDNGSRTEFDLSTVSTSKSGSVGAKPFVVAGGQISFFGISSSCRTWSRLTETALPGHTTTYLEGDLSSCWKVGDQIAFSSTDFDYLDAEERTIASIQFDSSQQRTELTFNNPLLRNHWGRGFQFDGKTLINEAGEVALLTRNIKISGQISTSDSTFGAHFMIYHTASPQTIQGIEFFGLGQQGVLGRYPIHFHMCLDTKSKSLVSHNSIHDTLQRCVVVHGTHNLQVKENVAFRTKGHCFMLEDGIEYGNVFIRNIGFVNEPVQKLISQAEGNTDNLPSTFWITNPNNTWIENVAAGSHSGYWFELNSIRGPSKNLPEANGLVTKNVNLHIFQSNVAHSNSQHGLRTYPFGFRPPKVNVFSDFVSFKNHESGVFTHSSENLEFRRIIVADNTRGVSFDEVNSCTLIDSILIGETDNVGNPSGCEEFTTFGNCRGPVDCALPVQYYHLVDPSARASTPIGRTIPQGGAYRHAPIFGVVLTEESPLLWNDRQSNMITENTFVNFDDMPCRRAAALTVDIDRPEGKFHVGQTFLSNDLVGERQRPLHIIYDPRPFWPGYKVSQTRGSAVVQYVVRTNGGFLVAPNDQIIDPSFCSFHEQRNAHYCTKVCYRTIGFSVDVYPNATFKTKQDDPALFEDLRLILTWKNSLGKVIEISLMPFFALTNDGKFEENYGITFTANLLSLEEMGLKGGYTARLEGSHASDLLGRAIRVRNLDLGGCAEKRMEFHFPKTSQFEFRAVQNSFFTGCKMTSAGAMVSPSFSTHLHSELCSSGNEDTVLYLFPTGNVEAVLQLTLGSSPSCLSKESCSLVYRRSTWKYLNDGSNKHPSLLEPVGFPHFLFDDSKWPSGQGELGYNDGDEQTNVDNSKRGLTAYFRKTFDLVNSGCITDLRLGLRYDEAIRVYLNGREIVNLNLPTGQIAFDTPALDSYAGESVYASYQLTSKEISYLVEGKNILSAEVHQKYNGASEDMSFDLEVFADMKRSCSGSNKQTEICDGLDNDGDGKVDEDASGNPLTRVCYTPCGKGVETCKGGKYVGCTARMPEPEICDGIDNNCDGLVDNTHDSLWLYILQFQEFDHPSPRLDCASNEVCFLGTCSPIVTGTVYKELFPSKSEWAIWDSADSKAPSGWPRPSASTYAAAKKGFGELGFGDGDEGTVVAGGAYPMTTYFVKTFSTSRAVLGIDFGLLCDAGCIVYLNGVEVYRDHLPSTGVNELTPATSSGSETNYGRFSFDDKVVLDNIKQPGETNMISVEVHRLWKDMSFDAFANVRMEKTCADNQVPPSRGEAVPLTKQNCVVNRTISILPGRSEWKYFDQPLDSTVPFESFGPEWAAPNYNDGSWSTGRAYIGFGRWYLNTDTKKAERDDSPMTMYFRKTINVEKAHCIISFQPLLWAEDSAVVYINGKELLRDNLLYGNVKNSDPALQSASGYEVTPKGLYGGNFFQEGKNVISVEVHRYLWSKNMGFDFGVDAHFDVNCLESSSTLAPSPLLTPPPTLNKIETVMPTKFPTRSPTKFPSKI